MYLVLGIIGHIALAWLMYRFLPKWVIAGLCFFYWELGQLRNKLPGSVKTLEKWQEMFSYMFTDVVILSQWILPLVIVATWHFIRKGKSNG